MKTYTVMNVNGTVYELVPGWGGGDEMRKGCTAVVNILRLSDGRQSAENSNRRVTWVEQRTSNGGKWTVAHDEDGSDWGTFNTAEAAAEAAMS